MPTEAKRAMVESADGRVLAEQRVDRGRLPRPDRRRIRRHPPQLRSQGVSFRVVKNRLAKIAAGRGRRGRAVVAARGAQRDRLTAGDEAAAARAVLDALRPYRSVKVRGAVVGRRAVDADGGHPARDAPAARGPAGPAGRRDRLAAGHHGRPRSPRRCGTSATRSSSSPSARRPRAAPEPRDRLTDPTVRARPPNPNGEREPWLHSPRSRSSRRSTA